jgi:hypothetical protein
MLGVILATFNRGCAIVQSAALAAFTGARVMTEQNLYIPQSDDYDINDMSSARLTDYEADIIHVEDMEIEALEF